MSIKRYIEDKFDFKKIKEDFGFLVDKVTKSNHGYDLQIRENYFNLYYRGNNVAKIEIDKDGLYTITTHTNFYEGSKVSEDSRFKGKFKKIDKYGSIDLAGKDLAPFFQEKYLKEFSRKIEKHAKGEATFQQMLISDNSGREDLLIIDSEVGAGDRKRIDLLALKKKDNGKYQFVVIEVKLGNNKELEEDKEGNTKVADQLDSYVKNINDKFYDYKSCYEKNFCQKKALGLFDHIGADEISIEEDVMGLIIITGYSELADERIEKLREKRKDIKILQFKNYIEWSDIS